MNKNQNDLRLLPLIFKKIAFVVLLFSILAAISSILNTLTLEKELVITISKTGILISLLILALTKDKIEDELLLRIRLKAFASSFIFGVGYVIFKPFVNLLFDSSFSSDMGVTGLLILMFLFYFYIFYSMKKNR